MTPTRLAALVTSALGRPATRHDLEAWGPALARVTDDDGDRALVEHRRHSPHPPTPADVVRLAIGYANDRHDRAVVADLEAAREHAVPPTPEYLQARARLTAAQAARDADLTTPPDEHDDERMTQARAELDARRPAPPAPEPADA